MKDLRLFNSAALLVAFLLFGQRSPAQHPNCNETAAIGAMARANSPATLKSLKQRAGDSYRAQLIFVARTLEIDPSDKSAAKQLLDMIPKDEFGPEEAVWLDLLQIDQDPNRCLPESDLKPLGQLQYHLPRLLARAVLLIPEKMPEYVAYATISTCPDCDYAVQMRKVCLAEHAEFVSAINRLSARDKRFFLGKIFNPEGCRTLMFPEQ